jgi:saccharopine dehydrogenase-like NADP-dependent oxidoreductase
MKILLLGAGRSATVLIDYLAKTCEMKQWQLRIGDIDLASLTRKIAPFPQVKGFKFNLFDEEQRENEIAQSDLVISMVPANYHIHVANACLRQKKHLLTASYVGKEIRALDAQAKEAGILILMECGLDPGIDHMSAMRVIDGIRAKGHSIRVFESFAGGLCAPSPNDTNPWEYRFTWNPRNVVLAGQGVVKFVQEGRYKYIPYHRVFRRTEIVHIPGHGFFEGYANRDSLSYREVYGLENVETIYRGTFRKPGFCKAWDIFVQLGATDDSYEMEEVGEMTHRQFINSFLSFNPHDSVELKLAHYLNIELDGAEMYKLRWLGLFDQELVGLNHGTPAQILEHILKKKWALRAEDRDMIVMWHKFEYYEGDQLKEIHSHMVAVGDDQENTAMAKTVGLPLGIAAKMILEGKIKETGVKLPVKPSIYNPILDELENYGIRFTEREVGHNEPEA